MDEVSASFRRDDHADDALALEYVRQAGDAQARADLAAHLQAGCTRCALSIRLWTSAVAASGRDRSYAPPDASVRQARGAFALRRPTARRGLVASLAFDSALAPLWAGVRASSSGSGPRQLLYKAGRYVIRLRAEDGATGGRALVGQVVDERLPGSFLADVTVMIFDGKKTVDRTITNRLGEFSFENAPPGALRLAIGIAKSGFLTVAVPVARKGGARRRAARGGSIGSEE